MRQAKHELTNDPVVRKIMDLLRENHKTEKELEQALGVSNGCFGRWKYLEGKSYKKYISEIANFLNVTSDYLLNDEIIGITMENMSESEMKLIQMYRKMNDDGRNCLFVVANTLVKEEKVIK